MYRCKKYVLGTMVALPLFTFGGCQQAVRFPVRFDLDSSLGQFEVTAGQTVQKSGSLPASNSSITVGSGALRIDPSDITFTPADTGSGKGLTAFQTGGGSFIVTAGIAAFEDLSSVCASPVDEYGPFTVTLNEDSTVASITPSSLELEQSTIDLINGGAFSICLTVESTVDGTVTIDALSFLLGL